MITPIFVIGKHRSGTTWLANQLCEHPLITGIRHEKHFGIHESVYFSHIYGRYGDIRKKVNYAEFAEVISANDYFRIAGVKKEVLYSLWPASYEEVFRIIMDEYAMARGANFWVEKSPLHTLMVSELAHFYPDAKFISIIRRVDDVVASNLSLKTHKASDRCKNRELQYRRIKRIVSEWTFYNKMIKSFDDKSERMLMVSYEALRSDTCNVLRNICLFLEIEYDDMMLKQSFKPNTSFKKRTDRQGALSKSEKMMIFVLASIYGLIPLQFFISKHTIMKRFGKRGDLPTWFFRLSPFFEDPKYKK